MDTAATWPVRGRRGILPASTQIIKASWSATQAPVTLAVRVPPSACRTSQSIVTVYSPRARILQTVRRLRPIRRSISMLRPLRAFVSRLVRLEVAAGSMAYSAVTQPSFEARRQGGRPSSIVAAHSTRVSPNSTRQEPRAFFMTSRLSVTGRIWLAARPPERRISFSSIGIPLYLCDAAYTSSSSDTCSMLLSGWPKIKLPAAANSARLSDVVAKRC